MTFFHRCYWWAGFLLVSLSGWAEVNYSSLKYYTENYPPANYYQDKKLVGVSVETLEMIWDELQIPPQEIKMVSWARGYRFALHSPNTVLLTMTRTPTREALFKWVGPIFSAKHVMVSVTERELEVTTLEQAKAFLVATIRDDISETSLLERGFPTDKMHRIKDVRQALKLLNAGRVDFMVMSESGFATLVEEQGGRLSGYTMNVVVNQSGNYFAFHLDTPDELTQGFQHALDNNQERLLQIVKKYGVEEVFTKE